MLRHLIQRLQDALDQGPSTAEISGRQAALLAYLDIHMAFEEGLMQQRSYPLAASHAHQHNAFRDQVAAVFDGLKSGTVTPANVGKLLLRIHSHHMKYHDHVFCQYLVDKFSLHTVSEGAGI